MGRVQAGVSRVTITPPVGTYLVGMERAEGSQGLRDDLYATALALSDGTTTAAVVTCDLLMMHPDLVARVRRDASARTRIPAGNIMLCASHCHSGPVTHAFPDSHPMVRAYVENLAFMLSGLIKMAHDRMEPVHVGFGRGEARIGINRRLTRPDGVTVIAANPDGPVDPEVGVLRVDAASGQPIAVLVNYACHPVVLGNGSNVISADWPGGMRRVVEQATGTKCLFIQGAGADVNPLPGEPADREDILEQLGADIGEEVISVWGSIEPRRANNITVCSERVQLPLLPPSDYEGLLPEFVELDEYQGISTWNDMQMLLRENSPWAAEIVGEGDNRRAVIEMQALRVGNTAIVSAAGEIFVEVGLAIKRQSPLVDTIVAGYTNGCIGYIPLPADHRRGGYEINETYLFYQLPAPIAPQAAGLVQKTAQRLLKQV